MRIVVLIAALLALVPALTPADAAPETPVAIDGTQYTVIAPVFTGSDGNLSYLRLINRQGAAPGTSAKTTTFSVMVVGSPSGQVYGTAQIAVPALAAPQYAIGDILSAAGASALSGGDTGYSLYLQDADSVAYEHVIFNGTNGFFENVGVCDTGGYINDSGNTTLLLPNVHTSVLATYPSQVFIHNYAATSASYQVNVIDAHTGVSIGTVGVNLGANTSTTLPETYFEQSLHWTPDSDQQHVNLVITNSAGGAVNAVVGQYIYNQQLSAYINMSMGCDPNAVATASPPTVQRVFKGVMAQTQVQSQSQSQSQNQSNQDRSGTFTIYVPSVASGTQTVAGVVISNFNSGSSTPNPAAIGDLGPPFALTGSYSVDTGQLTMTGSSGAGGVTTFTGTVTNGVLTGTYGGNNQISGVFAGLEATLSPVALYCGLFQANGQAKAFMLAANGNGTATGITTLNTGMTLAGTMTGTATSGAVSGQSASGGTFSGTIQNGQMTGNYSDAGATFTASACPAAIPLLPSGNTQEEVSLYILVNKNGGSGTVSSSTGGSSVAGTDRSQIGSTVTLTATPASGSTFRGWGGACSGTGPCVVTMNTDEAVSATFCGSNTACTGGGYSAPYTFNLTVNSGGVAGYTIVATQNLIDCVSCTSASVALDAGTQFSLNATVPPGTNFAWGGACSGGGTCFVTMNSDTQVTATLKPLTTMNNGGGNTGGCTTATGAAGTYALNVTVNQGGTGGFSISSSPSGFLAAGNCSTPSASFAAGTTVTLTATGSANQVFTGWGGACSGTGTCVVTMNSNVTVTANYSAAGGTGSGGGSTSSGCSTAAGGTGTYTLSFTAALNGTGGYSVVSSPSGLTTAANCNTASASFPAETSVTLTATGTTNQVFQGWTGACGGTGTCTVVMNANKSVGATFNP